ncbi:MAG TPA: cytochrome b N-terminal domain-containing protein [Chloroflexia bacterium]|nr:cytochrome b N-terminal domain-containing protein [Chloroflexia bacterium]
MTAQSSVTSDNLAVIQSESALPEKTSPDGSVALPLTLAPPADVSTSTKSKKISNWVYDRTGLNALQYKVPAHANTIWYILGGITFMGIVVLAVTGIWLAQYYNPSPAAARESVIYIQDEAPLGDIIRGIHVWTAYIVIITAVLHMIRIVVTAAYKIPREVNWLVGIALLAVLLFVGVFTGTILRWDQEAYEAMTHNMELTKMLGAVGGFFSDGFTNSVPMLPRLYGVHVSIMPLILVILLISHFFLIKHHGISPTASQFDNGEAPLGKLPVEKETGRYSRHALMMVGYGMALLGVAGTLAVLFPQAIGASPDPSMEITKPPFVFFWLYPFENWFGVPGILYAGAGLFGLLTILPFIDHTPLRHLRRRPVIMVLGLVLLVAVVVLSIMTAIQPVTRHLG